MNDDEFVVPPEEAEPIEPFPWPAREGDSVLEAFTNTWRQSVFTPASFYRRMPHEGNYGAVIAYYLAISVIAAGVELFWSMLLPPNPLLPFSDILAARDSGYSDVVGFLFTPVLAIIMLYLFAGVLHVMLMILGGAKSSFETTTRVVAFSNGPSLFAVVPYVGILIAAVWTLVITVIGAREAHQISTAKAAAALLLPIFLIVVLGVVLALLIGMVGVLGSI